MAGAAAPKNAVMALQGQPRPQRATVAPSDLASLLVPIAWLLALVCVCAVAVHDHHTTHGSSCLRPGYQAAVEELSTAAEPLGQPWVLLGLKHRLPQQLFGPYGSITLAALAAHPGDIGLAAALLLPYLLFLLLGIRWLRAAVPAQRQADVGSTAASHAQPSASAAVSRAVSLFCAQPAASLALAKLLPAACGMLHTIPVYCLGTQQRHASSQALQLLHPLTPVLSAALTLLSQAHPFHVLSIAAGHLVLATALLATYTGPHLPGYSTPLQAWLLLVVLDVLLPAGIMWFRHASAPQAAAAAEQPAAAAATAAPDMSKESSSSSSSVQFQTPVKVQQQQADDMVNTGGAVRNSLRHRNSSGYAAEPASPAAALFVASPDVQRTADQHARKQPSSTSSLQSSTQAPAESLVQRGVQHDSSSPRAAATSAIAALAGNDSGCHHSSLASPPGTRGSSSHSPNHSPSRSTPAQHSQHLGSTSPVLDFEDALAACARGVAARQAAGLPPTALYRSTLHHHVISIKAPLHAAVEGQELLQLVLHHLQAAQPTTSPKHPSEGLPPTSHLKPQDPASLPTSGAPRLQIKIGSSSPTAPTAAPMVLHPVAMRGCLQLLLPLCLPVQIGPSAGLDAAASATSEEAGSTHSAQSCGSCVFDVPAAQLLQGLSRAGLQQASDSFNDRELQRGIGCQQQEGPKGSSTSAALSSNSSRAQAPSKALFLQVDSSEPCPATPWLAGCADACSAGPQPSSSSSAGNTPNNAQPKTAGLEGSSAGCWLEPACVLLPPKAGSSSGGSSGSYTAPPEAASSAAARPVVVVRGLCGAVGSLVRVLLVQDTAMVLDQLLPAVLEDKQQGGQGSRCVRLMLPEAGLLPGPAYVCVVAPPSSLASAASTPAGISPAAAAYMGMQTAASSHPNSDSGSSGDENGLMSARMWACLPLLLVDTAEAAQELQQLFGHMCDALQQQTQQQTQTQEQQTQQQQMQQEAHALVGVHEQQPKEASPASVPAALGAGASQQSHDSSSAAAPAGCTGHSTAERVSLQHWQPLLWDWLFAVQGCEPSSTLDGCIPELAAMFSSTSSHPTSLLGSLYEHAVVWAGPESSSSSGSSGGSSSSSGGASTAQGSRHAVVLQLLDLLVGREMWGAVQQLRAAMAARQAADARKQHSSKVSSPPPHTLITAGSGDAEALSPHASSRHDSCKSYQLLGGGSGSGHTTPPADISKAAAAAGAAAAAVAAPGVGPSLRKQALQQQQAKYVHTLESPTRSRPPKAPAQAQQQQQQQEGWDSAGLGVSPAVRPGSAAAALTAATGAAPVPVSSAGLFTPHRRHSIDNLPLVQHNAAAASTDLHPPRWSLDLRSLQQQQQLMGQLQPQQQLMQPASFLAGIQPMAGPLSGTTAAATTAAAVAALGASRSPLSAGAAAAAAAAAAGAAAAQATLLQLQPGSFNSPAASLQSPSGLLAGSLQAPGSGGSRYSNQQAVSPLPFQHPTLARLQSHNTLGYSPSLPSAGSLPTSVFFTAEGAAGLLGGPGVPGVPPGLIGAPSSISPLQGMPQAGSSISPLQGMPQANSSSISPLQGLPPGAFAGPAGKLTGIAGGSMGDIQAQLPQPVAPGLQQQHQPPPVAAAATDGGAADARHWAVFDTTGVEGYDQGAGDLDTAVTTLATNASRANSVTWLAVPTSQSGMALPHSSMRTPRRSRQSGALFSSSTGKLRRSEQQHAFSSSLTPQPPRSRPLSHQPAASSELIGGSSGSSSCMIAAAGAANRRQGARMTLFSPVSASGSSAVAAVPRPGHSDDASSPQDLLPSPPATAGRLGFNPSTAAAAGPAAAVGGQSVANSSAAAAAGASHGPGPSSSRHTGGFSTPKRPGPPRAFGASPIRPLGPWSPAGPMTTLPTIGSEDSWDQNAHAVAGLLGTPPAARSLNAGLQGQQQQQQGQQQGLRTPQRPLQGASAADTAAWVATLTPGPHRAPPQATAAAPRSVSRLPAGVVAVAGTPQAAGLRGQQGSATPAFYGSRAGGNLVSGSAVAGAGAGVGGEGDTVSGVLQLLGANCDEAGAQGQSQGGLLSSFSSGSSLGGSPDGPNAAKYGNQGGYFTPVRPNRAAAALVLPASARPASRPAAWGTPAVSGGRNAYPLGRSGSFAAGALGATSGTGFAGAAAARGPQQQQQQQVPDTPLLKAGRSIAGVLFSPAPPLPLSMQQQQQRRILSTPAHIMSLLPAPGSASASKLKPAAASLLGSTAAATAAGANKPPSGPTGPASGPAIQAGIGLELDQQQQQEQQQVSAAAAATALLQLSPSAAAAAGGQQVPATPQAPDGTGFAGGTSAAVNSSSSGSGFAQPLFMSHDDGSGGLLLTEKDMHTPMQSPRAGNFLASPPAFSGAGAAGAAGALSVSASGPLHSSSSSGALQQLSGSRAVQCSPPPAPLRPLPGVMLVPADEAEDLYCSGEFFAGEEGGFDVNEVEEEEGEEGQYM